MVSATSICWQAEGDTSGKRAGRGPRVRRAARRRPRRRGETTRRESAAALPCADRRASCAAAPGRAAPRCVPAGSTRAGDAAPAAGRAEVERRLVGLGPALETTPRARVRRLGEKHRRARPLELHDKPPARRRLDRRLDFLALPALQPAAQILAIGGNNAPSTHLAGRTVKRVEGDLAALDVEAGNDGHKKLLTLKARSPARLARVGRPSSCQLSRT